MEGKVFERSQKQFRAEFTQSVLLLHRYLILQNCQHCYWFIVLFCEEHFTSVQNMCTLNASNITSKFRIFAMFVTVLPGIFYTQCVGMWPSN
jgi:hypothetical protein